MRPCSPVHTRRELKSRSGTRGPNRTLGAARDKLKCDTPDPAKTEGAVKIGVTVLDHNIAEGVTKMYSLEFVVTEEGPLHQQRRSPRGCNLAGVAHWRRRRIN